MTDSEEERGQVAGERPRWLRAVTRPDLADQFRAVCRLATEDAPSFLMTPAGTRGHR